MPPAMPSVQDLYNLQTDIDDFSEFINTSEVKDITTRLGKIMPSLKKIVDEVRRSNSAYSFTTLAALQAAGTPQDISGDDDAEVDIMCRVWNDPMDSNNRLYGWDGAGWVPSKYDIVLNVETVEELKQRIDGIYQTIYTQLLDETVSAVFSWGVVDDANNIAIGVDKDGKTHADLTESYKSHIGQYAYSPVGKPGNYVWGVVDDDSKLALGITDDGHVYANLSVTYQKSIADNAFETFESLPWSWGVLDENDSVGVGLTYDGLLTFTPSQEATQNIDNALHESGGVLPRFVWGVMDSRGKIALGIDRSGKVHSVSADEINASNLIKDNYAWGVVDESGQIALGVKTNGKVYFDPDPSVTGISQTVDVNTLNGPGNNYMAVVSSATTVDYLADGEGVVRGYRQRTDIDSDSAMFTAKGPIEYLVATGQSLSVGGGASENPLGTEIFTTTAPAPHYGFMFNTGTRGAMWSAFSPLTVTDLVPAYEQFNGTNQGETQGSGMMRALHHHNENSGSLLQTYLYRSHGAGGARIQDLQKDSGYPMFANGLAECVRAQEIAALYNRELIMRAFTFTQGEQNRSTDLATYYSQLNTLINDYQAEYAAILPENNPTLVCIIDQLAAAEDGGASDVPLAHLAMARDRADTYISTPKYMFEYSGPVHLVPKYYSILGEYQARVWRTLFIDQQDWQPVWPLSVTRNANVIDILCHVPTPPLVIDTDMLPAAPDLGFTYADDSGNAPAITSVDIVNGNTIQITLASTPTGTNQTIEYANSGPGATGRAGAWGNIHDSNTEMSQTDSSFPLYNWLVIFNEVIT